VTWIGIKVGNNVEGTNVLIIVISGDAVYADIGTVDVVQPDSRDVMCADTTIVDAVPPDSGHAMCADTTIVDAVPPDSGYAMCADATTVDALAPESTHTFQQRMYASRSTTRVADRYRPC
jgi:hypothetical protein